MTTNMKIELFRIVAAYHLTKKTVKSERKIVCEWRKRNIMVKNVLYMFLWLWNFSIAIYQKRNIEAILLASQGDTIQNQEVGLISETGVTTDLAL